jgi:ubiquinone/menaquinone biosynthesis C-methylase UbiE
MSATRFDPSEDGIMNIITEKISDRFWYGALVARMISSPPRLFTTLQRIPWYRRMLSDWARSIGGAGPVWLEVGCGPGLFTAELARQGRRATGVDRSAAMLHLGGRLPEVESEDVRLVHGDAYALPFPDHSFDVAVAASLLNVVDDPQRALREMARVTKPEGRVSCLVPSDAMHARNVERHIEEQGFAGHDAAALRLWSGRARKITRDALLSLGRDAGLQELRYTTGLGGLVGIVSGRPGP